MASKTQRFVVLPANGGRDETTAPILLQPDQLVVANNIEYLIEGSRRKRLGCSRYNATAMSGGPQVTALADFWRYGTSLTPTQKFVAHAGTIIRKDDGDGIWDDVKTAWGTAASETCITIADDFAVFLNGVDTPRNGTRPPCRTSAPRRRPSLGWRTTCAAGSSTPSPPTRPRCL